MDTLWVVVPGNDQNVEETVVPRSLETVSSQDPTLRLATDMLFVGKGDSRPVVGTGKTP